MLITCERLIIESSSQQAQAAAIVDGGVASR